MAGVKGASVAEVAVTDAPSLSVNGCGHIRGLLVVLIGVVVDNKHILLKINGLGDEERVLIVEGDETIQVAGPVAGYWKSESTAVSTLPTKAILFEAGEFMVSICFPTKPRLCFLECRESRCLDRNVDSQPATLQTYGRTPREK